MVEELAETGGVTKKSIRAIHKDHVRFNDTTGIVKTPWATIIVPFGKDDTKRKAWADFW